MSAETEQPTTPAEGKCTACQQTRPLFWFSWVPAGWHEFKEAQLCARCHSDATIADENEQPMPWMDLFLNGTDEQLAALVSKGGA